MEILNEFVAVETEKNLQLSEQEQNEHPAAECDAEHLLPCMTSYAEYDLMRRAMFEHDVQGACFSQH